MYGDAGRPEGAEQDRHQHDVGRVPRRSANPRRIPEPRAFQIAQKRQRQQFV